jgi:hypothetical protein
MNYRDNTNQRRFSVFIGIILISAMLMSTLVPLVSNMNQTASAQPTVVPTITPPPPINDLASITFDRTYLHPSGLFSVKMPSGWLPTNSTTTTTEAQMTMGSSAQLSVIEVRLVKPTTPVTTAAEVGQIFTKEWLDASWREYQSYNESLREVIGDTVQIDFTLSRNNQDFIARQIARVQGDWVYITRVVTPVNAADMLRYLLAETDKTIEVKNLAPDVPLEWASYSDATWQHLIRLSGAWQNVDGSAGAPASFESPTGVLRVEAIDGKTIANADEASAFATSTRSGLTVQNVKPVTHGGIEGFQVAYTVTNLEGETESGAMVLLPGADSKLHVANLRLTTGGTVNLNDETAAAPYAEALQVLNSFVVYAGQNITQSV